MSKISERLTITLDKINSISKRCDHDCINDSQYCGGLEHCKYTSVGIKFNWKYDDILTINLYFTLRISILYDLIKETLYHEKSFNMFYIRDYELCDDSLCITQSEEDNGLETVIEIGRDLQTIIQDKDMQISLHILKRFKEIYTEYIDMQRRKYNNCK